MDLSFCRTRGNTVDIGCDRAKLEGVDRVDPSPRDLHQDTCRKEALS